MKTIVQSLRRSRIINFALKVGITLFVFWLVFRGVDFAKLQHVLSHQNHAILFVGAFLLFLQMTVGALKWDIMLNALRNARDPGLSKLAAFKIYYISMFFTSCLPGAVGGDVVRVWLTKSEQVPLPISINSVIIDRMIALTALIIIVMATMPMLGKALGLNPAVVLPVMIALGAVGILFLCNAERILAPVKHIKIVHLSLHLISSIKLVLKKPRASLSALGLGVIAHCIYSVAAWVLALSLDIDMTFLQSITLMPPVILATTLPISIGGWGVREMGIIGMLGLIGIPEASALVLSLQLGLLTVIITLPASFLWLARRKNYSTQLVENVGNPA